VDKVSVDQFVQTSQLNKVSKYQFHKNLFTHRPGRAAAQAVSRWLPTAAARVRAWSGHVGFVVDKVTLGQVLSEYFGFPCQS
jgi:hypothetical protein